MHPGLEQSVEALFASVPDGLIVLDQAGRITQVNRRAAHILGNTENTLIDRPFISFLAEGEKTTLSRFRDNPSALAELTVSAASGRTSVSVEATAQSLPEGHMIIALRDVTLRKREEAVARSRARQQALVAELGRRALTGIELGQLMDEAVRLLVTDLGVEYGNLLELLPDGRAVFRAGVGWRQELVGGTTVELRPGTPAGQVILDQAPIIIKDLRCDERFTALSVAHEHGVVSSLTVPIYGQARPLGVLAVHTASPREFSAGDVHFVQAVANVVAAVMERTRQDERQRELQLGRAEQMAAMGQVAAGVAHELRNPLTSIKGLIQVNLREAAERGLPADDIRVIEHELRRMERTLQTFLDFARPPRPQYSRFDLTEAVDRVLALVRGRAGKQKVSLAFEPPDAALWVKGDQDQLQQLFLNLILNALDVMPHGGTIEVDFRPPRDGFIEALVRDTGPGIAPHVLPKVFETFVSSKETGLGLGLPVSRRIAEDHGGSLTAYNLPAGGACFTLRLPASD